MIDRNTSPIAEIVVGEVRSHVVASTAPLDFGDRSITVIADQHVWNLYDNHFPGVEPILIPSGESAKSFGVYQSIMEQLLDRAVDRSGLVVALGGGVTTDLAGYAAATFRRGIGFAAVPTTLLAMVDAAIGGKNGINLGGVKNVVGTIRQPELVAIDTTYLETLPEAEVRSGLAEVIKTAAIADLGLFEKIEVLGSQLYSSSRERDDVIHACARIKADVVTKDAFESGLRRTLNFGHTLGHALEVPGTWSHGEAVAAGMVFAVFVSERLGLISGAEVSRLENLIEDLGLPLRIPFEVAEALGKIAQDKKRQDDGVHFVVLESIGRASTRKLSFGELEELLRDFC